VTGSCPSLSTVTTSPISISSAEISLTTATDPVGMVGDIEPVLNMISVMFKETARMTSTTATTPPAARRFPMPAPR